MKLFPLGLLIVILFSCNNPNDVNIEMQDHLVSDNNVSIKQTDTVKKNKSVKYEIIRTPNNGTGVFDFIYVVYVPKKIDNAQADWIFNDIIKSHKSESQIDIDIWNNKAAFYEELKIYQEEDKRLEKGEDIKYYMKDKQCILDKDDKYNIASYSDNGMRINKKYPNEK